MDAPSNGISVNLIGSCMKNKIKKKEWKKYEKEKESNKNYQSTAWKTVAQARSKQYGKN
jgi:hypothetical protein